MRYLIPIFFLTLLFNGLAVAKTLYKWTDKNGVVHYSEKKPDSKNSIKAIELKPKSGFQPQDNLQPVLKPHNLSTKQIISTKAENFWQLVNPSNKPIKYYFGGDCVSPTSVSLDALKDNHRYLMPSDYKVTKTISDGIVKLGFPYLSVSKVRLGGAIKHHPSPLILEYKLTDMSFDLCFQKSSKFGKNKKRIQVGYRPFDYGYSKYKRRRAKLTLEWSLRDGDSNKVLFQGASSGSANHWKKDTDKHEQHVLLEALTNSVNNLFANKKFNHHALASRNSHEIKTIDNSSGGMLDSIGDFFNSSGVKKANFAKVLASIQPLKTMATEYYMTKDEWPTSLETLGMSQLELIQDEHISKIIFDYDGTILLYLSNQKFPQDATVTISPIQNPNALSIQWQCETNLDESYYQNNICRQM